MNFSTKPMIIYFVTKADEVVYIGQTRRSLEARKKQHVSLALSGKGSVIGAAIRKHGLESFVWNKHSVYYNQTDLDSAEKHLISKYTPRYNVAPGGQFGIEWAWNKDRKETRPEVLQRISDSAKNRRRSTRGPATQEANNNRVVARTAKLRERAKPFICHQNGKVYKLVTEAAKDIGILANGIYAVLHPKHRMRSYKGFTFSYLE
jgi:predicted GIY-YIG superfamily endonuclease